MVQNLKIREILPVLKGDFDVKLTTGPECDVTFCLAIDHLFTLIATSAPVQLVVEESAGPVMDVFVDAV